VTESGWSPKNQEQNEIAFCDYIFVVGQLCYTANSINNKKYMYTKEQIWNSISNDMRIIKHLFTKIPEGQENYKPTEKQRSTLELLQYIAVSSIASTRVILENNPSLYSEYAEKGKLVTMDNFVEMIDKQEAEMLEFFNKYTEEELNTEIDLWGTGVMEKKSDLFLNMIVKTIPAYKMQLFLYIKSSGNTNIGTSNLWRGMDAPVKN
jgi:hypothetical protein